MAMEWLAKELIKTGDIKDLHRAKTLRDWISKRGGDFPLEKTIKVSRPPIHGGSRDLIEETRDNGTLIAVPKILYPIETYSLSYAAKMHVENPVDPFFECRDLVNQINSTTDVKTPSGVYKMVARLESWGYLVPRWETLDSTEKGRHIRKHFIAITPAGLKRITPES